MTTLQTKTSDSSIKNNITLLLRKIFVFFFALSLPLFSASAADWVLAGETFTLGQKNSDSASLKKAAELLPQLILEQISLNKMRVIPDSETLDRKLNTLQTERLSLFLELEKEIKARDSLVISEKKPKSLEKKLVEANKKIAEIQEKIEENIKTTDEEIAKFEKTESERPKIESEDENRPENSAGGKEKFAENAKEFFRKMLPMRFFKRDEETKEIVSENVVLYKNDVSALFKASDDASALGKKSYAFSKEVISAKINGLLSGSIVSYGEYIGVTAEIFVYPGAKSIGTVTEVGSVTNLVPLAKRILQNMAPKIANNLPVLIKFDIDSADASKSVTNPVVTIDGVVSKDAEDVVLDSGVHTISIEAPGFESASMSYSFSGDIEFSVVAKLVPVVSGSMNIRLKKFKNGLFYANAIETSELSLENEYSTISVNGKDVLSVFEDSETKERAFVYIPFDLARDGNVLSVSAKTFDRAENIDKRRIEMYIAYSALICSLPFTFYSLGEFDSRNNAYAMNRGDYDDLLKWQKISNATQVVSFVCLGWFAVELVRYLFAANRVLPAEAKIDRKTESYHEKIEILKVKEAERKAEEDAKKAEESESEEESQSEDKEKSDTIEEKEGEENGKSIFFGENQESVQAEEQNKR